MLTWTPTKPLVFFAVAPDACVLGPEVEVDVKLLDIFGVAGGSFWALRPIAANTTPTARYLILKNGAITNLPYWKNTGLALEP
jgi:hypothetical protein